uniref:Uncharacterized protein n=1 Tax=Zeugodacus cucurbitae TaxID=28588 RepID=A0A0A1WKD3_ZEUCU
MNPAKGIINVNTLEELEYRRCTWWSSFLENMSEREDGEVYDVNSIAEKFDDDTSSDDADEAEEVQVLEDIEYHNLMNQSTQQEKTTFIMESEEMQDILNSTRPILKEHELKLKASGLERIMNTFDSARIEREVGGWMRRNRSAITTQAAIQTDSDTDSSMSCEDDHYIRSVQNCHHMRKPKHIQYFKKCKSYQTACCKYGMLVEPKPHRSYTCNCYKYNSMRSPKCWKMPSTDEPEIIDKRYGKHKHKMRNCIPECGSSSASDYDCQERLCFKRNMTPSSHTERLADKRCFKTVGKPMLQNGSGTRMMSMMENVYETPTKSTVAKASIPNTAPSKISTKRGAARKALSLLNTNNKKGNAKSTKSKRTVKTQENQKSSSEGNTTFENDLKSAIALSLQSLKQNRNSESSVQQQQPSTSSESTNNSLQLAGSSRNGNGVQESVSTTKTRKKTEGSNKPPSKSVKKQSQIKKVNRKTNEAKENTFLNNLENICNSTALNGAAASKQLPSCLPVIPENSECSPTASPCTENEEHTVRKLTTNQSPAQKESPIGGSVANSKMETQFKNVFSSTTIHGTAVSKSLITTSPPVKEQVTPCKPKSKKVGIRNAATEPRRKQKRNMVNNKTMGYRSSVSPTPASVAKVKPNRIMLYTPQRKARTLDGHFQVTKELMSSVIGEEHTRRFFKYHIGKLTFPKSSTVYYCPPETDLSSSDSDDDPLLKVGCCGELYESEKLDDSNVV